MDVYREAFPLPPCLSLAVFPVWYAFCAAMTGASPDVGLLSLRNTTASARADLGSSASTCCTTRNAHLVPVSHQLEARVESAGAAALQRDGMLVRSDVYECHTYLPCTAASFVAQ